MEKVRQEVVDFVSTRIRHDMETQQELLRCRNFDEIREVQTRFIKTAMDQYTAEFEAADGDRLRGNPAIRQH